jgi:hypothetical protein
MLNLNRLKATKAQAGATAPHCCVQSIALIGQVLGGNLAFTGPKLASRSAAANVQKVEDFSR